MRERILGTAWRTLLVAVVIIGVPSLIAATTWPRRAGFLLLILIALGVSRLLAVRQAGEIAAPVGQLVEQAEKLGDGATQFQPLRTGIDEIDRISQVFERRAGDVARSLAAEREFASDASHQLRTPLTALLMRLEEISMSRDIDEVHAEADVAIEQVERLASVVDNLLQRSRRNPAGEVGPMSLDSVIAALQREFQPAFETARRSVRVGGERGLWVNASRVALSQIISTLFENTLAHGSGTVDVIARRSGPSVVLEVSDLGSGVDPSIAPHIFERRVTTGGTGLGLALARDLANASGGRLELRRAQPAMFALFLRAAEPPPLDDRTSLATDLAKARQLQLPMRAEDGTNAASWGASTPGPPAGGEAPST